MFLKMPHVLRPRFPPPFQRRVGVRTLPCLHERLDGLFEILMQPPAFLTLEVLLHWKDGRQFPGPDGFSRTFLRGSVAALV